MDSSRPGVATAAVIGVGEMGGVFARALLRAGHVVVPVLRKTGFTAAVSEYPHPDVALVAVGESDLPGVLAAMPEPWKDRVAMLQNELLPRDWEAAGIKDPTVAVVWFEKKPGQDVKVIIPSPIGGPAAGLLHRALGTIGIPSNVAASEHDLIAELVTKNLYILTANIGGLITGGTVRELWEDNNELARAVGNEVLDIQAWLTGTALDRERHFAGMEAAFAADPGHKATGRSAPARLARALDHAAAAAIDVPRLTAIAAEAMVDG